MPASPATRTAFHSTRLPPVKTNAIRVGARAGTTRGFGLAEFRDIADMVADVLDGLVANGPDNNSAVEREVNQRVRELCSRFPIYSSPLQGRGGAA